MEDVLIGSLAQPYIFGEYLVIADYKSNDKLIQIFDKKTFKHLLSLGDVGQGPEGNIQSWSHCMERKRA